MDNQAKLVLGLFLIFAELISPGFGFTSVSGAQGMGYNFSTLLFYSLGAYLSVTGYKGIYNKK